MTAVLRLLAGPNGAGKSTFARDVLAGLHLPFVNADHIAARDWPDDPETHAYEASARAAGRRQELLEARTSFITETVFSHPSKTELVGRASVMGYHVTLHVFLVPLAQTLDRVEDRVAGGGHSVPREKIVARYERLWTHIARARLIADVTHVYDNSSAARPFRRVARYAGGRLVSEGSWPAWSPLAP